ncbi:DUF3019 domain-containing protein [Gilvimarinus algae]|uniref:DUF3019 domain-containing protein n=1 Tax=Gilvimarinus algae TaxID=3058037 RepID=A0ABT8TJ68_9GAMM|nr:DUF3019 domain-containing protein [Gilvimarinus sp. SDUM040014]MDO3384140.1 DUF3019 domain-containing protein [Gilvimarinus sp. SDUM040014]
MGSASWGQGAVADEAADVELIVHPSLCILERGESLCRDQVEVSWRAGQRYTVCLYELGEPDPLHCWEQSRSGAHTSLLEAADDVHFQLIEMADQRVLASHAFEVVADAQRYRRRRRNPWSFF